MSKEPMKIFLNLPVADLAKATAFYEAIGATKNAQFSDGKNAACMVFSDCIHAMLLTHEFFRTFTPKQVADARSSAEVLICLSADSRAAVDAMVEKAAEGGRIDVTPLHEHGYMYGRSFEDPDGHNFQIMWMDAEAMKAAMAQAPDQKSSSEPVCH